MPVVAVISTFPSEGKAVQVARTLVEEQLVACVNLVPRIRSIYRWKGEISDDIELLAIMKTTADRADALVARLVALHPYELPEAIVLPVAGGNPPYLQWVADSTCGS